MRCIGATAVLAATILGLSAGVADAAPISGPSSSPGNYTLQWLRTGEEHLLEERSLGGSWSLVYGGTRVVKVFF